MREAQPRGPAPKLAVEPPAEPRAGANARLGVTVRDSADGGLIVVSGLASGATLSAGNKVDDSSWWLSFADLDNLEIRPPEKFVGAMDVAVELRLADTSLSDRTTRHIEWVKDAPEAKAASAPAPKADEQESLLGALKRGQELIAQGDVDAARQLVRRAADPVGDARPATPPNDRVAAQERPGDGGAAQESEKGSSSEARDEGVAKAESSAAEAYRAGCFVKIDGRVRFDGRCQIRWAKDTSVTFALDRDPVTLTREHGRAWRMVWGERELGKVYKRNSCWGSRRAYVCERNK